MATLAAGLVAAIIFLMLTPHVLAPYAPYARAKSESPAEVEAKNEAHLIHVEEMETAKLTSAHGLLVAAPGTDRPFPKKGTRLSASNSSQVPKTNHRVGKMPRVSPESSENNEVETSTPPRRERDLLSKQEPHLEAGAPFPLGRCDALLTLVDRSHPLPQGYAPTDMVPLETHGVRTLRGNTLLRLEAAEDLALLMEAAHAVGEDLIVASAYRSYDDQEAIHTELTDFHGEEAASRISAPPGHSEHQLGLTVDFTNHQAQYRVWSTFEGTSAYGWLVEHAADYGFVQSYEKGEGQETGYQAESWHYRYVGVENARHLKSTGLSLQAFLVREGILPRCE